MLTHALDTAAVEAALADAIASTAVPGVVGVLADRSGPVHLGAHGLFDAGAGTPMPVDAIFRIASLTKAVTGIATMQLVEAGALDLDAEVASILPEFDEVQVLDGFDGDRPLLRRPARKATVRNLLTHTSGLTYDAFHPNLVRYGELTGVPMTASAKMIAFQSPMVCDPGTAFTYGMSSDWTGLLIQHLHSKPLADCFRDQVFAPLGIRDITFEPDAAQRARVAPVHLVGDDDAVQVIEFEFPSEREFDSAGHGLYASAGDYLTIQRLLLGGGEVDGVRLLKPETFALMSRDQLAPIPIESHRSARPEFSRDMDLGPGLSFGLDISITTERRPGLRTVGSLGWCGTFNSFYWVDRDAGVTGAVHMQYLPFYDARALRLAEAFERAVYRSLER